MVLLQEKKNMKNFIIQRITVWYLILLSLQKFKNYSFF